MKKNYIQPVAEVINMTGHGIMADEQTWNGTSTTMSAGGSDAKKGVFDDEDMWTEERKSTNLWSK